MISYNILKGLRKISGLEKFEIIIGEDKKYSIDKATETKKTYIKMTTKALLAKILGISMFGYLVGIA